MTVAPKVPLRVRLAIASDRSFKQLINVLWATHHGVWLGALRSGDLAAANAAAYAKRDRYSDANYNRSGLTDWEREVVKRDFPPGSGVLVPSAGGGREVLGLEALGYRAVGFDPSPVLVAAGREILAETGSRDRLLLSPADGFPDGLDEQFDAILFGWGGYVHIRGRSTRVSFLSNLRRRVDSGAPMLLSFFLRSPNDRTYPAALNVAKLIRRIRRSSEPIELGDTVAATFDHYFTWEEIEAELAEGGFEVIESSTSPYPHVTCRAV